MILLRYRITSANHPRKRSCVGCWLLPGPTELIPNGCADRRRARLVWAPGPAAAGAGSWDGQQVPPLGVFPRLRACRQAPLSSRALCGMGGASGDAPPMFASAAG